MGNLAFIRSGSAQLGEAFRAAVPEAVKRFGDAVRVVANQEVVRVTLSAPNGQVTVDTSFWLGKKKVEWKHSHDQPCGWWFELFVATKAASLAMHALERPVWMEDEGTGKERLALDFFQKFPRMNDWAKAFCDPFGRGYPVIEFEKYRADLKALGPVLNPEPEPIRLIPS